MQNSTEFGISQVGSVDGTAVTRNVFVRVQFVVMGQTCIHVSTVLGASVGSGVVIANMFVAVHYHITR